MFEPVKERGMVKSIVLYDVFYNDLIYVYDVLQRDVI